MTKKLQILLILTLFISLGWQSFSETFYSHSHVINGKVVHHSHPYSKGKTHEHSEDELTLIAILQKTAKLFFVFTVFALTLSLAFRQFSFYFRNMPYTGEVILTSNTIRAPAISLS